MKASVMLEHEPKYTIILAFDVKVERDAQDMADSMGVKIFQADIIYHLFDRFMAYQEELKMKKKEEFKHVAVFPCKLKMLPTCIFNSRDPIVAGVSVEAGIIRTGTPLCVPSKDVRVHLPLFCQFCQFFSLTFSLLKLVFARAFKIITRTLIRREKAMKFASKSNPYPASRPKCLVDTLTKQISSWARYAQSFLLQSKPYKMFCSRLTSFLVFKAKN